MDIRIPFITGLTGTLATVVSISVLNGASLNQTAKNSDLKKIQVYFYDKASQQKTMRMSLSLPFSSASMEFPKAGTENGGNKWEKLESNIKSEDEVNKTKKRAM